MVESCLSYFAYPVDSVGGVISVPGDKSISHRALMLGAVAEGSTQIEGILKGEGLYRDLGCVRKKWV